MITTLITLLIYVCVVALVFYLIIWVLGSIGVPLPAQVLKILWVILALFVILWLTQAFLGGGGLNLPRIR
jgi:hypothetical protein